MKRARMIIMAVNVLRINDKMILLHLMMKERDTFSKLGNILCMTFCVSVLNKMKSSYMIKLIYSL